MAIKINRVQAYKTTDGQLMTDRDAYLAHERKLAFGEKIASMVSENFEKHSLEIDGTSERVMGQDELNAFILNNADTLRLILNGKTKRVARAKKAKLSVVPTSTVDQRTLAA
jgi:hypothetical protein